MRPLNPPSAQTRWEFTAPARVFVIAGLALSTLPFTKALLDLFNVWNLQPEYSHGLLIPPIALFLLWQKRAWLATTPFAGAWSGVLLVAVGLLFWLVGELSTIKVIVQYAFLIVLYGLVVSLVGWNVFRQLWMPFLVLLFMIPLPAFFSNTLSLKMQLLSSAIGVWLIRMFGISVFLEGNVIDLGSYQLQVAEACDGLRYLFPLMTLAFILSYFFRAPLWKRVVLFVASVPIAILMNSLRIGVIGITVEYWGPRMAEGLLHDFEGWVVFMFSMVALLGVAALLVPKLRDALVLDIRGAPMPKESGDRQRRPVPQAFIAAAAIASVASLSAFTLPPRAAEATPPHTSLVEFPNQIGEWRGQREPLERVYRDTLQLDDYLLSDYRSTSGPPVNIYVAFYESQRQGHSVHSPRSCLPGGGWVIRSFEQRTLTADGRALPVNRALIELGNQRQVVYYWFQQRGRAVTNEYAVKWYIFWDALTRNRTDGALVRLVAPVGPGMDVARADEQLTKFASVVLPRLGTYIPD